MNNNIVNMFPNMVNVSTFTPPLSNSNGSMGTRLTVGCVVGGLKLGIFGNRRIAMIRWGFYPFFMKIATYVNDDPFSLGRVVFEV